MHTPALRELYTWAKASLGKPVLLNYTLDKVNGQSPGSLWLLLREAGAAVPSAEIEVIHYPERRQPYQVIFSTLPFRSVTGRPSELRPSFGTQQQVMQWIRTARQ